MIDATLQAYMGNFFSTTIIKNKPADLVRLATTGLFGVLATTGLFGTKCPKSPNPEFLGGGDLHQSKAYIKTQLLNKFQKNS